MGRARSPDSLEALTSLRGVGPKIAALTLAVGFGRPAIAVDIHVHRIVNRYLGYVATSTPEKTMLKALAAVLPERILDRDQRTTGPVRQDPSAPARDPGARRACCSPCVAVAVCRTIDEAGRSFVTVFHCVANPHDQPIIVVGEDGIDGFRDLE